MGLSILQTFRALLFSFDDIKSQNFVNLNFTNLSFARHFAAKSFERFHDIDYANTAGFVFP